MHMYKSSIISVTYKHLVKPILFRFDPETVHDLFLQVGKILGRFSITKSLTRLLFSYQHPSLEQTIHGIPFKNPVGLAAGFDKDAQLINILPHIGFGFAEIGTVTYKPYEGNPKPRLYRLIQTKGIIVNYGLKNLGVKKIIQRIQKQKDPEFPLSVSVGKTNSSATSSTRNGINDYYNCLKELVKSNTGNFYTINISCPNTFGGEPFTTEERLKKLLFKLNSLKISMPIFLKMPINLPWKEFKKLLDIAMQFKISGVIIGNLNKDHHSKAIKDLIPLDIKGGIIGKPTWELSNNLISKTFQTYGNRFIIIGVGGIFSAEDAYEKIKRGASLLQLITGMIFEGPQLIGDINKGLVELLNKDGYTNISQAVGTYNIK